MQLEAEGAGGGEGRCPPFTLVPGGAMLPPQTEPHPFSEDNISAVDEYGHMGVDRDGGRVPETGRWDACGASEAASSGVEQAVADEERGLSGMGHDTPEHGARGMVPGMGHDTDRGEDAIGAAGPAPGGPAGQSGALAEGKLAKLAKKQKDWVEHYCVLSCKPREGAAFGGIDFAYMLDFFEPRALTGGGHDPVESIHAGHAAVKFVQGM